MAPLKRPIAIYHEHPHWFERLFAELDRRGTPYERVDATRHHFDIEPNGNRKYSLVFNRMSPSAYTRGHGHGIYYTVSYLEHLERLGIRVEARHIAEVLAGMADETPAIGVAKT